MPARPEDREARHRAIRQILSREDVANQEELVERLVNYGVKATQSGVSRDLRLLGVVKQAGFYRIPIPLEREEEALNSVALLIRNLKTAGPNLIVGHTEVGSASRAAFMLDGAGIQEIVGTVAGDDTIFIAVNSARDQQRLMRRLKLIMVEVRS